MQIWFMWFSLYYELVWALCSMNSDVFMLIMASVSIPLGEYISKEKQVMVMAEVEKRKQTLGHPVHQGLSHLVHIFLSVFYSPSNNNHKQINNI